MLDYLIDVSVVTIGVALYYYIRDWWEIRKWRNYSDRSYYGDIDDY